MSGVHSFDEEIIPQFGSSISRSVVYISSSSSDNNDTDQKMTLEELVKYKYGKSFKKCKKCKLKIPFDYVHCDKCDKCFLEDDFHCENCNKHHNISYNRYCKKCNECFFGDSYSHCDFCEVCTLKSFIHCFGCERCVMVGGCKC